MHLRTLLTVVASRFLVVALLLFSRSLLPSCAAGGRPAIATCAAASATSSSTSRPFDAPADVDPGDDDDDGEDGDDDDYSKELLPTRRPGIERHPARAVRYARGHLVCAGLHSPRPQLRPPARGSIHEA